MSTEIHSLWTKQKLLDKQNREACVHHLIDLRRMFGEPEEENRDIIPRYQARFELDIDPGPVNVRASVQPYYVERSYVGSQFAD